MKAASVVTALLSSLLLLGCAAPKPEFVDPVQSIPASWTSTFVTTENSNALRQAWWQQLQSPELDALVKQALSQNTSIARAANAVALAQAELNTIKLGWLPSLNVFGGRITGNTTLFFQGLPVPVSNVGNFIGVLPNYFINMFRLPYQQRQAMELVDVAIAEQLAVRVAVVGEVVGAYTLLWASEREIVMLEQLLETLKRQQLLLRDLQSVGIASQAMVNQTSAQVAGVGGDLAIARANQVAARNALNTLVRKPLGTTHANKPLTIATDRDVIAALTPTDVLNARPDIVAERSRVLAATTGIDAETMLLAPTLDFNALRTNISTQTDSFGNSSNANFTAGYAALTLDPQIFGLIETSQVQAKEALLQYVQTVDQAIREVDDAIAQLQGQLANLAAQTNQANILARNVKDLRSLHEAQLASELEVLEAQIEWILARMVQTEAQTQAILAYATLQQTMGVGTLYGMDSLDLVKGLVHQRDNTDEATP